MFGSQEGRDWGCGGQESGNGMYVMLNVCSAL